MTIPRAEAPAVSGPLIALVDHLQLPAALVDERGAIAHANASWRAVAGPGVLAGGAFRKGVDYVAQCSVARRDDDGRLVAAVAQALDAVGSGRANELTVSYVSLAGGRDVDGSVLAQEPYSLRFVGVAGELGRGVLVTHRPQRPDLFSPGDDQNSTLRTIDLELANERLREEQRRQRGILDSIPDIAWLKDADGHFLAVNKQFAESSGMDQDELVGKTDLDVWVRELAERYRADDRVVMGSRAMKRVEEPFVGQNGRRTVIETIKVPIVNDAGQVIGTAGISRDITERKAAETILSRAHAELEELVSQRTEELRHANERLRSDIEARERAEEERKRLEQELLQSQKLEGIGRLAGGIAHDFNNLLTIILAYGHQGLAKLEHGTKARSYLTEMVAAAQRAAELTRQLLAFARKQVIEPRVLDLNELLLSTDGMLRPLIGADVELVTLPSSERCMVKVDPGQFERILLNLAANARDAMPSGGKLVIATSNVEVDADFAAVHPPLRVGLYVRLRVTDSGEGIAADVLPDIFDPFFTTKNVGSGTGLGLATCYGIVKQAGGHVVVRSEVGRGTTFDIYLPPTDPEAAGSARDRARGSSGGNETLLLAEDEANLRAIATEILREEGYFVLSADSGAEAVRIAEQFEEPIHLLITDIVMPHMSGKVAAARVSELRPSTRVLYMSGYAGSMVTQAGRLEEGAAFLAKPFTSEALLARVRELLDAVQAEASAE